MHPWRPWIALSMLAAAPLALRAAVIYKWTDADGVVHFSDQPAPGAERIVTSGLGSHGITVGADSPPAAPAPNRSATSQPASAFAIDSPGHEQHFTGDVVVSVHLQVDPALRPDQAIAWRLNGRLLTDQPPESTQFNLSGLGRGSYVLEATLTDAASGEALHSDAVTFYIQQPSTLMPQQKKP